MKINVASGVVVGVQVVKKSDCPAGTAYWQIDYTVDGVCIHSATTGAIYGNPDVIAMLDREYTYDIRHYLDIPNPDKIPSGEDAKGRIIREGTVDYRTAWWEEFTTTHRQAIISAFRQLAE